mgnify:CR=1 FL=1
MSNIVLIGFMGSGKSTIAKSLASELDKKVIDMDHEIEREEGRSIADIFKEDGEVYFRDLETDFLERMKGKKNKILSTGGGVILREENIKLLNHIGTVVFLQADVNHIYNNVQGSTNRPLLDVNDVLGEIQVRLEAREPYYLGAANVIIQTSGKTVDAITREIVTIL